MRNIYIKYLAAIVLGAFTVTACTDEFLEVDPSGTQIENNYYKSAAEAYNGLVAAYDPVGWEASGSYANFVGLNIASDDHLSGGGSSTDVPWYQVWNTYTLTPTDGPQIGFWSKNFTGVSRANTILSKLEGTIPGLSEENRKRYVAEAKFLRAYYYFDLVRLFRNVPLVTAPLLTSEIYNIEQASPDEVYGQIEKDLTEAFAESNLPNTVPAATEGGRITKGAVQALLGKVLLYQKKWVESAKQLAEVNGTPGGTSKYGYKLLTKYSDIFVPTNKFHTESILEIAHTSLAATPGSTPIPQREGLFAALMTGPRSYSGPTYSPGFGLAPITLNLYNAIRPDPRYKTTVANIDSLAKLGAKYVPSYLNTGYFMKKFAPLIAYQATSGQINQNYPQNYIEIRLADTYLMEAEAVVQGGGDLGRAAALLNAVRARVGLLPVAATLDNIYQERRLELATEGHRWYDLVRTGRAATVLAFKGFVAGKHEVLPIPLTELTNTKLVQNPNY